MLTQRSARDEKLYRSAPRTRLRAVVSAGASRPRQRWPRLALLVPLTLALASCTSGRRVVEVVAPVDPEQVAARLALADRLREPQRVIFEWSITEQGVRASGRGVTRQEPPARARLDLFLDNGEAAGRAVLVADELRVPARMPLSVVPPSPLLWGALGVFRPEAGSYLAGAEVAADETLLRYLTPDRGRAVHYRLSDGRISSIEVLDGTSVVQRVTLERDSLHVPVRAVFRDLVAVRELVLTRVRAEPAEPFPPDIWHP